MGPTPQDLNMAGVRKCSSIKLQLAVCAKLRAEKENEILSRLDNHEEKLSQVLQEMEKIKKSVDNRASNSPVEHMRGHLDNVELDNRASNSPVERMRGHTYNVEPNNHRASNSSMQHMREHTDNVEVDNRASNSPVEHMRGHAYNVEPNNHRASSVQHMRHQSDDSIARSTANGNRFPNSEVGRDVILYSVVGQHVLVAKATIKRTCRTTIVGGAPLGLEYCEVLVNYVLKKNAPLPRPYNNLTRIGDTQGHTIAWPYERMEDDVARGGRSTNEGRNQVFEERRMRDT